ncbi:hypothetical protein C8Q80DRAFT_1103000 [Daedaleopsis nitida]|nr:hypothetical protein C8Q80DRAFT_1103000 [Daedaleopsis nitida]
MPPILPLQDSTISFDISTRSGFLGAEAAWQVMMLPHLHPQGHWWGRCNCPGSYQIAKRYGQVAGSQVFDGAHTSSLDLAALNSNAEATHGPKFVASFSGTVMAMTGPIGKLLVDFSKNVPMIVAEGRVTTPHSVTIVDLDSAPNSEEHPSVRVNAPVIVPIAASAAAAAACGVTGDWKTFTLIIFGMAVGGYASSRLQAGDLTFTRPATTPGAPAGDGYLDAGNELIVLKGSEDAVSSVTRGRFTVRFKNESSLTSLATAGTLLSTQCFVQLLFVPFGTVLGQLFFLLAMAISWLFNAYVASQEKAAWKRLVLEDLLKAPTMERHSLGTRTMAAVFLMQMLKPAKVEEQLALLLPNNTPVWKAWRQTVARRLQDEKPNFAGAHLQHISTFTVDETKLLETLFGDAQAAVNAFQNGLIPKY